jgi:hypothetical protein
VVSLATRNRSNKPQENSLVTCFRDSTMGIPRDSPTYLRLRSGKNTLFSCGALIGDQVAAVAVQGLSTRPDRIIVQVGPKVR